MNRTDVIQAFLAVRSQPTYLEIGIRTGTNFLRIRAALKLAVDPAPRVGALKRLRWRLRNPTNRNNRFYRVDSDSFFAACTDELEADGLDVAFIDGLHTYEQSLRDTENCLDLLSRGGVVLLHDCSPPSAPSAIRASSPAEARSIAGSAWDGRWCGDVYKTILYLRSQRTDLSVCVVDCDRGIGIVRPGDARETLPLTVRDIEAIGYEELDAHRDEWLDLRPPSTLSELVGAQGRAEVPSVAPARGTT